MARKVTTCRNNGASEKLGGEKLIEELICLGLPSLPNHQTKRYIRPAEVHHSYIRRIIRTFSLASSSNTVYIRTAHPAQLFSQSPDYSCSLLISVHC